MKPERVTALTDGVLAIVLTILVLGFEVPEHEFSKEGVLAFLVKLRPPFVAYVVSFGVVAAYWVQHAVLMHFVDRVDRRFVWWNLAFLLPLTLLPFLTDLRVEYRDEYRVTVLYAVANMIAGGLLWVMWRSVWTRGLTRPVEPEVASSLQRRILAGIGVNGLGALVAPVDVTLSSLAFLSLPVLYLSHRVVDRAWTRED